MTKCPYQDYGQSADTSMGVYCNLTKECKEIQDCERCEEGEEE